MKIKDLNLNEEVIQNIAKTLAPPPTLKKH